MSTGFEPVRREEGRHGFSSLRALGLAFAVDVGGSIIATRFFIASLIIMAPIIGFEWGVLTTAWLFIIGVAGLFGGAFLAAHLAPSRPLLHAAALGAADILASLYLSYSAGVSMLLLGYCALALPAALTAGTLATWIAPPPRTLLTGSDDRPRLAP